VGYKTRCSDRSPFLYKDEGRRGSYRTAFVWNVFVCAAAACPPRRLDCRL